MTQHERKATMTTKEIQSARRPLFFGLALGMLMTSELFAGSIQGIGFTPLPGGDVEVAIKLDGPADPQIFSTDNPARIALDFADTSLQIKERAVNVGTGATKMITAVEAGNRSRVVIDLFRASGYETRMENNTLIVRVSNGFAGEAAANGSTTAQSPAGVKLASAAQSLAVKNVDFRRGKAGEGRILIDFNGDGANADLKNEGGKLVVDVYNAKLGDGVAQRMDVVDFATPVQSVDVKARANGARIEIGVAGEYEQLAYQAGNQFVVEIAPKSLVEEKKGPNDPPVYEGARATYNFQDIPVRSLLQLIADVSEFNLVVADSVQGNVTVRLINVPWDQALDIVLQTKGLDKRRNGNVIYIAPTKEIADREQALEDARMALEDRQSLVTDFIPISYGKAEDIASLLTTDSKKSTTAGVSGEDSGQSQGFLSKRGSISFDERTNTLLVVDIPSKVASIRELVGRLDKPVQQVLIESRIVVANDNYSKELGARFGISGATEDRNGNVLSVGGSLFATDNLANQALSNRVNRGVSALPVGVPDQPGAGIRVPALADRLAVNLPANDGAGRFGFTVLGSDYLLDLELSALESEGRGEIISSPRVITASQREATIRQGNELPYTVQVIDPRTGATSTSVQFKPVVLELKVTPTISPDQRIFMNLEVKQDSVSSLTVQGQPAINTRNINTAVLVDNGQTVVLGGILERSTRDDKSQVPFLGELPGVGALFKNKQRSNSRAELLIFVTPKILQDSLR